MTRAWGSRLVPSSFLLVPFLCVLCASVENSAAADEVFRPRVVIVSQFEPGADEGDRPGEFQFWVEREKLSRVIPLPAAFHDVRANADGTIIGIVTGGGTARAAATVMALGCDARFDLTKSYWLINGIAGVDPADASLGSAAWAEWVVDGDLAHEIDPREMPKDWTTGFIPLDQSVPYGKPKKAEGEYFNMVYHLNGALREWAFRLTRDTPLDGFSDDKVKKLRERYVDYPNARKSAFVLKGDEISASTFWHGAVLDRWANDWVSYWTDGKANYVMTAMEDSGSLQSLKFLAKAGRVDWNRIMVLRTASNYDSPPPGMTAAESLAAENASSLSAYLPSLEAAYAVGSRVVHEIVNNWPKYESTPPSDKP
ncbi:purine nucleoside permease [Verrucomicrobia bacterium SCGC AG-212-E04]|nr:purine nucleoside permease [Verrucomicrobia bacterium SCGC AG-212-E04]